MAPPGVSDHAVVPPSVKCEPQDPDEIPEFDTSDFEYSLKNEDSNLLDSLNIENNSDTGNTGTSIQEGEQQPLVKKIKVKRKRKNSQCTNNGHEDALATVFKKGEYGTLMYLHLTFPSNCNLPSNPWWISHKF